MKNLTARMLAAGGAGVAALSVTSASAQGLQPSGEWLYGQDAEACRAYRRFDGGAAPIQLQLRSFGPGSSIEVTVIGDQFPKEIASVHETEVTWGTGEPISQIGLIGAFSKVPSVTVLAVNRPTFIFGFGDQYYALRSIIDPAAQTLRMRVVGGSEVELATGSLQEPLARLAQCETALMEKWGWGAAYSAQVAKPPQLADTQQMFYKAIIYPAVQNLKHVSSILQLRLKIDAEGKVAECVVQSSPGSSLFGSKNCETLRQRGRFKPAENAQGQPIDGYMQLSVTFVRFD